MFELISAGGAGREHRATWPIILSTAVHVVALTSVIVVSVAYVSDRLPEVPAMMAFVAPPPPPPPPPAPRPEAASAARTAPAANRFAAPVEAPSRVEPETGIDDGLAGGVSGGVGSGIPGGVVGGVVAGLPADVPPPPPARRTPVRVGGMLQSPALVDRVAPRYPDLAVQARVHGTVILEAAVDEDGHVREVRVLRSIPLLDAAALEAVRQWHYSPLSLNGEPQPFILTVTVTFNIADATDGRL